VDFAALTLERPQHRTCIFRGDSTDVQCVRFNNDGNGALESVDVRFYCSKPRNTMPVSAKGYIDWISIGVVDDESVCFAALLREYYTISAQLPQSDDRLFIREMADKAHAGCHWGLSSQRLANIMKDVMTAAGIPPDFSLTLLDTRALCINAARGCLTTTSCTTPTCRRARMSCTTTEKFEQYAP
jgi:hypothetical protein